MLKLFCHTLVLASVTCAPFSIASATVHEVIVSDGAGVTRGSALVNGTGRVEISVLSGNNFPPDGTTVSLTNRVTGQALSATTTNGVAKFRGITAGNWVVQTADTSLTFTNVAVIADVAALSAVGVGAGTAILATGGGAAVGYGIHESSNNHHHSELSPSS